MPQPEPIRYLRRLRMGRFSEALQVWVAEKYHDIDGDDCATNHREYRKPPNESCMENAESAECQTCQENEHNKGNDGYDEVIFGSWCTCWFWFVSRLAAY